MRQKIRSVKGTRDFYPTDMAFRSWLYAAVGEASRQFGYQEYDGPILETLDLYTAKSSDELVKEQAYVFVDRGGDHISLRPELTPSLARMVAQRQHELPLPLRWWSFGPMWRYERPQKGRTREFFQWNVDLIGARSAYADAEPLAVLVEFFRRVHLTPAHVMIKINDRRFMDVLLGRLGIPIESISAVYGLIDKLGKLSPVAWGEYARDRVGLTSTQLHQLGKMLDNRELWRESAEIAKLFEIARDLHIDDFITFDPSIVRGLTYYTGLVFEAWERNSDSRAILGGGRYDNLVASVGGQALGGIGFAMGDVVIELVLNKTGLKPLIRPSPSRLLVTVFNEDLVGTSVRLAAELRSASVETEVYPDVVKLERQLRYAAALHIPYAVIIGPDEARTGTVTLRDLLAGDQRRIPQSMLVASIRK